MPEDPRAVDADVLVLGGGPTGLYAAYRAGFRGLTVAIADALPELGGQVNTMYPEQPVFDVAGFPWVRGRELIGGLIRQVRALEPALLLDNRAERLSRENERRFTVTTDKGNSVHCSAIVITGGVGTFTPRPLPTGNEFLGRGLAHFVTEVDDYRGKDVLVVGDGDNALDLALLLEPIASSVTLVHQRGKFLSHQHTVDDLRASSVRVTALGHIRALGGQRDVEWAEIAHDDRKVITYQVDRIIAATGFTAHLGPLTNWGISIENNRHILVDPMMRTTVPGIYAAGDITHHRGIARLISTAFGEAAVAVNNVADELDPGKRIFPGHSSVHTDLISIAG